MPVIAVPFLEFCVHAAKVTERDIVSATMTAPSFKKLSFLFISGLLLLVGWLSYSLSYRYLLNDELTSIRGQLSLFSSDLEAEIEKFSFLPRVLSRNQKLKALLTAEQMNASLVESVNRDLSYINDVARTEVIYLMGPDGTTIAASNWEDPGSFIGGNFVFRPYFKNALAGREGRYFALGTTSQRRGYYFSAPVVLSQADQALGVVVVKVNIEELEASWQDYAMTFLITDKNEVVFSSNDPDWQFSTLQPLSNRALEEIRENQQYPLDALRQTHLKAGTGDPGVLSLTTESGSRSYLSAQQQISPLDWTVYALKPARSTHKLALGYTALAILLALLSWGLFHLLTLRRFNLQEKLQLKRQSERQLKEAHDKLEQRVARRTRELRENNEKLEREIHERRQAEQELQQAQTELIHSAKMATLGQLASSVTHELNQPLASISNYAENAKQYLCRKDVRQTDLNLDEILRLSERMTDITRQLRTFSHKSDDQLGTTDLNKCIVDALALLRPRLNSSGINAQLDLLPEAQVIANDIRLEQVFINLFSNALDAMQDSPLRELKLEQCSKHDAIVTRVIDSGPGIEPNRLPHIFDAFFTTKSVGVGLGLGLSISSEIVQNLGGKLQASNHSSGGACFEVILRRAHPEPDDSIGQ